jgi:hypothetical protein
MDDRKDPKRCNMDGEFRLVLDKEYIVSKYTLARLMMLLNAVRTALHGMGITDSYRMDQRRFRCSCCRKVVYGKKEYFCKGCAAKANVVSQLLENGIEDDVLVLLVSQTVMEKWKLATKEIMNVASQLRQDYLLKKSENKHHDHMLENMITLTQHVLLHPQRKPHRQWPSTDKYDRAYDQLEDLREKTKLACLKYEDTKLSPTVMTLPSLKFQMVFTGKTVVVTRVIAQFFLAGCLNAEARKKTVVELYLDDSDDEDNDFYETTGADLAIERDEMVLGTINTMNFPREMMLRWTQDLSGDDDSEYVEEFESKERNPKDDDKGGCNRGTWG